MLACCGLVIPSKKYVFGLHPCSCHSAPQTLVISLEESNKSVFLDINEVSFGKHLKMEAGHQGSQPGE